MKGRYLGVILLVLCVGGLGCAQTMAICRPGPVDRSVLAAGTDRGAVTEALGAGRGRLKDGAVTRREHFSYADGGKKNTPAAKAGRVVLYTAADFFTAWLSQIIFMPAETLLAAKQYRTTVDFQKYTDGSWRVKSFQEKERGKPFKNGVCQLGN